jgi:hypothetical protein
MTSAVALPHGQTMLLSLQHEVTNWLKALADSANPTNIVSLSFGSDLDWGGADQRMAEWRVGNFDDSAEANTKAAFDIKQVQG